MNNKAKRKSLKDSSPSDLRTKYGEVEAQIILDNLQNSRNLFGLSKDSPKDSSGVERPNDRLKGIISSIQQPMKELKKDSFDKTSFIIPLD